MSNLSLLLVVGPLLLLVYAYAAYPAALWLLSRFRRPRPAPPAPAEWPVVSISLPVYNEEAQIRDTLDSLLALDYPADRRQILVISDASTDSTDEIVRQYADRGVQLLRMPERGGKTLAENAGALHLRGEIVVNTDASIRIRPDALKPLIRAFQDPEVGVASGRDVSVSAAAGESNAGEAGYVGYEMWVREMETRLHGIIGASGCFYAIRSHLHRVPLPDSLSRDFAAALVAREFGYRSVSVREAICMVPRTASLRDEYRRKVRTITRGIETLHFKRHLLNPATFGTFAWMLLSHKVTRWMIPWTLPLLLVGCALQFPQPWARAVLGAALALFALAALGWTLSGRSTIPRLLGLPAFLVTGNLAALHAGMRALHGDRNPLWEPTRRQAVAPQRAAPSG
jgi:cellulose synthase/poly-beta-1,6-N-acetylglucosamine synthase-like glycosyltransferase